VGGGEGEGGREGGGEEEGHGMFVEFGVKEGAGVGGGEGEEGFVGVGEVDFEGTVSEEVAPAVHFRDSV